MSLPRIAALVLLPLLPVSPLVAQDAQDLPMPTQVLELPSQDQLDQGFQNLNSKPFDDPSLEFQVLMRKDWKVIPVQAATRSDTKTLVPLLRLQNVAGDKFGVAVEAKYIVLEAPVRVRDWLEAFLLACKYREIRMQEGVYFGRETADCLASFSQAGVQYVTRLMAFRDGNRIFLLGGFGTEAEYRTRASDIAVALMGFTLKAPMGAWPIPLSTQSFSYPISLKFSYPQSWLPAPGKKAPLGAAAIDLFSGARDNPQGIIRVRLFSKQMPAQPDVNKVVASFLRELGVPPEWTLEASVLDAPRRTDRFPGEGRAMLVRGSANGKPIEVQLEVLSDGEAFVAVGLINQRLDRDPSAWMVNRGAFEAVTRSLSR